jgi:peptide/nickel transport system substrate-binding protein
MLKKILPLIVALLALPLALAACSEPQVMEVTRVVEQVVTETITEVVDGEEVVVEVTRIVEVPGEAPDVEEPEAPAPAPVDRMGAWVDTIVVIEEPSADAAVNRLEVGEIDLYAFQVTNPEVASAVEASANVDIERSFGSYSELSFNPVGPVFDNGNLNPFAVPRVREAMNWLVDREFIAQEIHGGMAVPRWHAFNGASNDYALMADVARAIEFEYSYDKDRAAAVIAEEMEALGAELVDGTWTYEGEPVVISLLIRTEDERLQIGDYLGNQLEDIGFEVFRDYKTAAEASPIWISGNPADGLFHIYTGGWITTVVPRNLAGNFDFFYTERGLASPLWAAYQPSPEFDDLALRLANSDFRTPEERRDMLAEALQLAIEDSTRVWLIDRASITPRRAELSVAADLYGGVSGSFLWPYTIQREGEIGGSVRIAMPSILTQPWNPLNGSNWIYDMMLIRGTGEQAVNPDPFTGLQLPHRVERAEVVIEEGLPVFQTLDWVTLEFADSIEVPDDAWADWDPVEQRFLTAAEVYTETQTVARMSRVYYPEGMFDEVTWHDGSPLSMGDFLMGMILTFDRGMEDSPVFDSSQAPVRNAFMAAFRGVRVVSTDPLIIEHYGNNFQPDAENSVTTWWPYYLQGQGAWHTLALGLQAEAAGEAAFSSNKADDLEVEWFSYIAGPTIETLANQLTIAQEEGAIPYAAAMSEFVSEDEIAQRFDNLAEWYRTRGHFWVGTGPFWLERAFPVEGTVILQRNANYPDSADKWARFAAPPIAEVEVDGPTRITIGEEATYDVFIDFAGQPYAVDDISEVKFLVFDASGALAYVGVAEAVEDGLWQVVMPADVTAELEEGSNRLEVVVVSRRVALPTTEALLFVTAP